MKGEISKERAAFLSRDYARGFIHYCQFEPDGVEYGFFQSRVTIQKLQRLFAGENRLSLRNRKSLTCGMGMKP